MIGGKFKDKEAGLQDGSVPELRFGLVRCFSTCFIIFFPHYDPPEERSKLT